MDRRKQDSAATTAMSATMASSWSWAEGEVAGVVAQGEVVHRAVVDAAHEAHGGTRRKGDLVVAQAQHTFEDWKLRHCRTRCSPAPWLLLLSIERLGQWGRSVVGTKWWLGG
jgi:hypothetical protein